MGFLPTLVGWLTQSQHFVKIPILSCSHYHWILLNFACFNYSSEVLFLAFLSLSLYLLGMWMSLWIFKLPVTLFFHLLLQKFSYVILFIFVVYVIEPKASLRLDSHFTAEPHPKPSYFKCYLCDNFGDEVFFPRPFWFFLCVCVFFSWIAILYLDKAKSTNFFVLWFWVFIDLLFRSEVCHILTGRI